jgi:hypothetical protein
MSFRFARSLALLSLGWALLESGEARAGSMDPALERLVDNPGCRTDSGAIDPAGAPCTPDQAAFTRLVNQFGSAFAPAGLHPARTTGIAGFQISIEGAFTKIDAEREYWKLGTRGPSDGHLNTASIRNGDPAALLQLYSLRLRKGFGGGFEVAGQFGFMPQTSFLSGGVDARWAILEGFRTGAMGYVPDLSLGGGVRTTTGSPQMQITVAAAEARLSKPISVADEAVITPWLGFQYLWIFGTSGLVDLTPATNAAQYCNQQGVALPGDPAAPDGAPRDGQPVCEGGSPADFANNVTFETVHLRRPRLLAGASYQYELVVLSGQFLFDVVRPGSAQGGGEAGAALAGESRQWGFALDAGVRF